MKRPLKRNLRSFRFSDESAAILEEYAYDLDDLVLDAYYRLPELKEQILMEKELLQEVQSEALKVRQNIEEIRLVGIVLSNMMQTLVVLNRRLDDLAAGRLRR